MGVDPESSDVGASRGSHCPAGGRAGLEQHRAPRPCGPALSLDRRAGRRLLDRSPGRRARAVPLASKANHALLSGAQSDRRGHAHDPRSAALRLFLTAALLLTLAPGPDTMFVLGAGLGGGPRGGLLASAGIMTGLLVHCRSP